MEGKEKLKYLMIPDEATQVIDVNEEFKINNEDFYDDATCICFKIDNADMTMIKHICDEINETYDKDFKYAISAENLMFMPYINAPLSYIVINDGLYMNISESKHMRWLNIDKHIKTDVTMLDPMAVYYFEEFEELKNKNNINE